MSRLYVTSSKTRAQKAGEACSELRTSGSYGAESCFARSYRKPSNTEDSFLNVGEDNFIAMAGTIVFDGSLGTERKKEIYELFVEGGVTRVRSQILGHYAIAVKKGDVVTLFTDPLGSFSLYYTSDDQSWCAANSLHACAVTCSHLTLNESRLLATALQSGLPDDRTFYDEIRRLFGTQVIRADAAEGTMHVDDHTPPTYGFSSPPSSVSDAVDRYTERVRSVFEQIAAVGTTGLMMTGGLDSRTVLAGLLDQGATPTILSGLADNSIPNTSNRDYRIARKVARELGLDFYRMNWSDSQPHSQETLEEMFDSYGFKYEVYGAPRNMIGDLKRKAPAMPRVILGGYSPAFTNMKPWERKKSEYEMGDLLESYLSEEVNRGNVDCKEEYVRKIEESLQRAVEKKEIEYRGEKNDIKKFSEARIGVRISRDARFANFVNEFRSYIDPFRLKRLYDPLVKSKPKYRVKNRVQVGVLTDLCEGVSNIEMYSGWKKVDISSGEMERKLSPDSLGERLSVSYLEEKMRNMMGRYFPETVERGVKKLSYKIFPQTQKDYAMVQTYAGRISKRGIVQRCLPDPSALPVKDLARLEYLVVGVESVAESREMSFS